MSTKEQSATLLRLNKQEQVKALQAVGFADITENSRASEFPNRIKWATGLLDMRVACNRIFPIIPNGILPVRNGTR